MIVTFCTDSLNVGGTEKALINLLQALAKDNCLDLRLCIQSHDKDKLKKEIPKEIPYIFLTRSNKLPLTILEKAYRQKKFNQFVKDSDVLIDFFDGNFYRLFSQVRCSKKIVYFHTPIVNTHINMKNKLKKALKVYDNFVVLSNFAREDLIRRGIPTKNTYKIYNIISPDKALGLASDDSNLSVEEVALLNDSYYVCVGRVVNDSKDYMTVIKAFQANSIKDKLYIVGSGPYLKELKTYVLHNNLTAKVKFLGPKDNPFIWIKHSKALILSSRYEGLSNVILEALMLDKKVIASDCPYGPREILKNNVYGALFRVGDSDDLVEIITNINQLNFENPSTLLKDFTSEAVLAKTYKLIN